MLEVPRGRTSGKFLALLCAALMHTAIECCAVESAVSVQGTINVAGGNDSPRPELSRVVVFLDDHPNLQVHPPDFPSPRIIQEEKTFRPNLLVVSRGTTVEFPNRDPYSHNVFSRSPAARFDLDRYAQGMSKSYRFDNVGLVQLFCNIHPQMRAIILVVPNRHFSRVDSAGEFTLDAVPAGQYALVVWHANTGAQRHAIEVGSRGAVQLAITFAPGRSPSGNQTRRHRRAAGVERGLGLRRERLNLPVVRESHPAP